MRIEGRWNADPRAPGVLAVISVSDGTTRRPFGVTALQAYDPPEEGPRVLRHTSLRPATLLLRGRAGMVARFMNAAPDQTVIAYGVYGPASGMFVPSGVDIAGPDGMYVD